jgi:hypothetical protein
MKYAKAITLSARKQADDTLLLLQQDLKSQSD